MLAFKVKMKGSNNPPEFLKNMFRRRKAEGNQLQF
jgi:hypothetical protein